MEKEVSQFKTRRHYFWLYTGVFLTLSVFVFFWFGIRGKSFIWKKDGLYQHFNSLVYYGQYLRGIVGNLFQGNGLQVPLWEFNIGYGGDILTTLHYYVLGDPLNLLAVFVPEEGTEVLYHFLILLRFYLAGIAFSLYCFRMKQRSFQTLIGSMVYIFCGYALIAGVRHPYFINPMIYFPLLAIGIENIFAKKKPYMFILTVFVSAASSFYFFYMITILAVIYAAIRFFILFSDNILKNLRNQLIRFTIYYSTGLLMACFIFVPVVKQMFNGGRLEAGNPAGLFYNMEYYLTCLIGFITPAMASNWTIMGYSVLIIPALFLLFKKRNKYVELKLGFILLTGFILLPIAGYVLHGFTYVSNRWIWGYSFLVALIVTVMIPAIEKKIKFFKGKEKWCIAGIAALSIVINAALVYSPAVFDYLEEFQDAGVSYDKLLSNGTASVPEIEGEFYRYEDNRFGQDINYNTALNSNNKSTTFYFSVANGYIYNYMNELNINIVKSFCYAGVDSRAVPGALSSTKYFVVKEANEKYLPYGYEKRAGEYTGADGVTYYAYENKYALPIGYTYERKISPEQYEKLSSIQKQQAVLQAAVTETAKADEPISLTETKLDWKVGNRQGLQIEHNKIIVEEKNAELTLEFDGQADCEYYLNIENLQFASETGSSATRVSTVMNKAKKHIVLRSPDNQWYENQHDFLMNAGYSQGKVNTLKVIFEKKGEYSLEDLEVICQPMSRFAEYIDERKADVLDKVKVSDNHISGEIELTEAKTLCLSVPYSEGWTIYVDGKKAETLQINTMYMGTDLEAGQHKIVAKYQTPGLSVGVLLAALGFCLFIGIVIMEENKSFTKKRYRV